MKKLSETMAGENGVIIGVNGDGRFVGLITSIGLTPGCQIKVLQNEKRQPILLYGRDTMIALNRKECEKITFGGDRL